jgi:hypothetical protein
MNTKRFSIKLYVALSLLNLVMMWLVGCGTLEVSAVEAKTVDPDPADIEAVEIEMVEIGVEPESDSVALIPIDQLPSESEASPILSDAESIRAALAAYHGMDESEFYHFEVKQNTGSHARGGVDNGYFLAAKVDEQWVRVDGGQKAPNCNEVARYDFPASMVPECELSAAQPKDSDEEAIRAALAAHFGLDESEFTRFEVDENTGMHARGGVAANDGGGYFLVAKVDGQWIFVDGGQSWPNCNEVARYGFPASMVPGCPTGGSNAPDCPGLGTTVATFIKDVTYADGTVVSPGQSFIKTWRIKNVGICTWNSDYQLVFDSGDAMSGPATQQLTDIQIPPGETLDISVELTAPDTSGTYRGNWKFSDPHGDIFGTTKGNPIWVEIEVVPPDSDDEDNQSSHTSYPVIQIADVNEDQSVTIRGLNFPPNDTFNVLLNYSDTLGIDGKLVATIKTGASGEFTDTYTIPAFLQGQDTIAIRLESPSSGYYAYNWFYNL